MITKKIILLLIIIASSIYSQAQPLTLDDVPLTWNDFRRVEKTKSGSAAQIFHGIRKEIKILDANRFLLKSILYIDTAKSEVKVEGFGKGWAFQRKFLLDHEKGHIALALIYHKMLEKTLAATVFTCHAREEMNNLNEKFNKLWADINDTYDAETKHGANYAKQLAWEKNILEQLNAAYSNQRPIPLSFTTEINAPIALKNKKEDPLSYDYCKRYSLAFDKNFEEQGTDQPDTADTIARIDNAHRVLHVKNDKNTSTWMKQWHQPIDYTRDFEIDLNFFIQKTPNDSLHAFNLCWGLDTITGHSANIGINMKREGR